MLQHRSGGAGAGSVNFGDSEVAIKEESFAKIGVVKRILQVRRCMMVVDIQVFRFEEIAVKQMWTVLYVFFLYLFFFL